MVDNFNFWVGGLGFTFFLQWKSSSWMAFMQEGRIVILEEQLCISARETWFPWTNERKFLESKWAEVPPRKHVFLEQMGSSSLGQTLFPYCLGQTMLVKELWACLPQEICKFPKENIGLQFSVSSEYLL